jgi:hypothetical protein
MKKILQFPWYVLFFSLFPVLHLMATNISQARYTAGLRSLLVSCLGAVVLAVIFGLVYRNIHRGAFAASVWVLLFFTYGQVFDAISAKWNPPHLAVWTLCGLGLLLAVVLALAAIRSLHFETLALLFSIVSVGLLVYPLFLVIHWTVVNNKPIPVTVAGLQPTLRPAAGEELPDIYYIVPEDYGRVDLLQSMDQIDVTPFMQYLQNQGFYIADCSQSNYAMESELSIGSALNMEYLQNLSSQFNAANLDQTPIWNVLRYNSVEADLKKIGYKTVAFSTGFAWSELNNSDVYYSPSLMWSDLTSFETQLLRTTPLRHLEDIGLLNLTEIDGERFRERTMLEFNSAPTLAALPGPKFVFMHIISPHEPFVFGPTGQPIDPLPFMNSQQLYTEDEYIQGYREQVPFVNMELEKFLSTLIAKSTRPVVIILQTDTAPLFTTGPDMFKILNAYYMPGHTAQLYAGISPVNTFRVVLNAYLGTNLPLLQDISYSSPIPQIYAFAEVSNPCTGK